MTLFVYFPSTDPESYLNSLERVSARPVKNVFPAHYSLNIQPEIIGRLGSMVIKKNHIILIILSGQVQIVTSQYPASTKL